MQGNPNPNMDGLTPFPEGYSRPAAYSAEVYDSMIQAAAADYVTRYNITPERMQETAPFHGMIKHIYLSVFKPEPGTRTGSTRNWTSNIDYSDTDLLLNLWNQYTTLCSIYDHIPNIFYFSMMIGISKDTINTWKNSHVRAVKSEKNSISHAEFVKMILSECEGSLYSRTTEKNSIGSMFALKALYGYRETAPVQYEAPEDRPELTPAEIARKYGNIAELPPPPEDI